MKMNWAALGTILFGLLLLFELYRYFWPRREARKKREEEALTDARKWLEFCMNKLSVCNSVSDYDLWNWLNGQQGKSTVWSLPSKLRDKTKGLGTQMREYNEWWSEAADIIKFGVMRSVTIEFISKWGEFDFGAPLFDSICDRIHLTQMRQVVEGSLDKGGLKEALLDWATRDRKSKSGITFKDFLEGDSFNIFFRELSRLIRGRPTFRLVKSVRDQALTNAEHLLKDVQRRLGEGNQKRAK